MGREILFRGRSAHSGEWCYGSLERHGNGEADEIVGFDIWCCGEYEWRDEAVESCTVGQFTCLHDAHRNKIFEGDILRWEKDGMLYVVVFRSGMFYADASRLNNGIHGGFPLWMLTMGDRKSEIVGNVHDNTEYFKKP